MKRICLALVVLGTIILTGCGTSAVTLQINDLGNNVEKIQHVEATDYYVESVADGETIKQNTYVEFRAFENYTDEYGRNQEKYSDDVLKIEVTPEMKKNIHKGMDYETVEFYKNTMKLKSVDYKVSAE